MWWLFIHAAVAGELMVSVDSPLPGHSRVACRLYDLDESEGFPGGPSGREARATVDDAGRPVCTFRDLDSGRYAVAAMLDRNGNNALDTSLIGLPLEPWGVTNNVRPSFRAPSFDEAAVAIPEVGRIQATVLLEM